MCGAFGTHAAPTIHSRTPITRAARGPSLGYAWTCSLGSCLGRSLPSKCSRPLSTVSSNARLIKAILASTRHAYLTHLLRHGPAWDTTWNAIDGRRFGILGRTGECLPCRLACTPLFLSRPPEPCYQNTWEPRTESRRPKYEREIYRTALIRMGTSTPLTRHMPELGTHTTTPRPSVF